MFSVKRTYSLMMNGGRGIPMRLNNVGTEQNRPSIWKHSIALKHYYCARRTLAIDNNNSPMTSQRFINFCSVLIFFLFHKFPDAEELSSRLMHTIIDIRNDENGRVVLAEACKDKIENPLNLRCIYFEELLSKFIDHHSIWVHISRRFSFYNEF